MPSFVQLFRYNFVPGAKMSCIKCIITRATFSSPVGKLDVQVCDSGLHEFSFSKETNNNNFLDEGSSAIDLLSSSSANKQVSHIHGWLKNYFSSSPDCSKENLPSVCPTVFGIDNQKASFRQRVWRALYERVGFGATVSYGQLAAMVDSPGASRAVGSAMANNPVGLVVPCHRVVKADGSAGNYAKCTKNNIKVWLIDHERAEK